MTTKEDIEAIRNNIKEEENPISCIFCIECSKYGQALLSQDLIKEFYRVNGFTGCTHTNEQLSKISLGLYSHVREYLISISHNYSSMYGIPSKKLIDILIIQLENKDGPDILQLILKNVGLEWLKSLEPDNYGHNTEHKREFSTLKMSPPFHKGFDTEEGWFNNCGCDGCSGSYRRDKYKESCPLDEFYKTDFQSYNRQKFEELDINKHVKEKLEELQIISQERGY